MKGKTRQFNGREGADSDLIYKGDDMANEVQTPTTNAGRDELAIKVYEQICTNIRTSDDISFKLLGFVPLISGSGAAILTLSKIWSDISSIAIMLISLVAAIVTFGLFKWELRNVQKCNWLIDRAAELERVWFNTEEFSEEKRAISQFAGFDSEKKPPLFGKAEEKKEKSEESKNKESIPWHKFGMGKTESERIIYWTSIAAWLVPIVMSIIKWKV